MKMFEAFLYPHGNILGLALCLNPRDKALPLKDRLQYYLRFFFKIASHLRLLGNTLAQVIL